MWKQENFKGWEVRLAELSFTRWALVDSRKPKELWTFVFPGQTCFIKTHRYTSLLGFLADLWGTCTFEVNDSTGHSMFVFIWPSMEPPNHAKPDFFVGQAYNPAFRQKRSPTIHIFWIRKSGPKGGRTMSRKISQMKSVMHIDFTGDTISACHSNGWRCCRVC